VVISLWRFGGKVFNLLMFGCDMKLKKCSKCGEYGLKEKCKKCGEKMKEAHYKFVKIKSVG